MTLIAMAAFLLLQATAPSSPSARGSLSVRSGVIAGRVQSSQGTPVADIRVFAIQAESGTVDEANLSLTALAQTDKSGNFRLEGLPPGRYYVGAGPLEAWTLYPGVTRLADARAVSDRETVALEFSLNRSTEDRSYELTHVPVDPRSIESSGRPVTETTRLERGQTLQLLWEGTWWAARIVDLLPDGRVEVHYLGWDSFWDEIVPRSRLQLDDNVIEKTRRTEEREKVEVPVQNAATPKLDVPRPEETEKGMVPAAAGPVHPTGSWVSPETKLNKKQVLLVEWGTQWWAARIVDLMPDGEVKIHYLGWESWPDEIVPRSRLQLDDEAIEKAQRGIPAATEFPLENVVDSPTLEVTATIPLWDSANVETIDEPSQVRFSKDGQQVRVFSEAIATYDKKTGATQETLFLSSDESVAATSTDGSKAILHSDGLVLLDVGTGRRDRLPQSWFTADSSDVTLSGDGRLLGVYSSGEGPSAMVVDVYDLEKRTHLTRRTSGVIAAGGILGGGISTDGRFVEFTSNRTGTILVDLDTGRPGPPFAGRIEGFETVRSSDGLWAIQIPNHAWAQDTPLTFFVRDGRSGKLLGQFPIELDEETFSSYVTQVTVCNNRAVLGRQEEITVHDLPSGRILGHFQIPQDSEIPGPRLTACSPDGKTAGVVVGSRLLLLRIP